MVAWLGVACQSWPRPVDPLRALRLLPGGQRLSWRPWRAPAVAAAALRGGALSDV